MINSIEQLKKDVEKDQSRDNQSFAVLTSKLLADQRVTAALERRFSGNESLRNVCDAGVVNELGLVRTLFLFSPSLGKVSDLGVMVLSNATCSVVAVLEDFDYIHPNPHLPPLPIPDPTPDGDADPFDLKVPDQVMPFLLREETVFVPKDAFQDRYKSFQEAAKRFNARHDLANRAYTTYCTRSTQDCTGSAPTTRSTGCAPDVDDERSCRSDSESYACDSGQ